MILEDSKQIMPDDLLSMRQKGRFELVNGKLVERSDRNPLAAETVVLVTSQLYPFIRKNDLGTLAASVTYRCFSEKPNDVRRIDLSFISRSRLHAVPDRGHVGIAPDLAIEVLTPTDLAYGVDERIADYRSAGIPLTWILNPSQKTVRVIGPQGIFRVLQKAETLDGGDVLPGLTALVGDLFPQA